MRPFFILVLSLLVSGLLSGCATQTVLPSGPDNPSDPRHPAQLQSTAPLPRITSLQAGLSGQSVHQQDAWNQTTPTTLRDAETSHVHATSQPATEPSPSTVVYTCPMHPEVTSGSPGKCPKCGMTLQPKNKEE